MEELRQQRDGGATAVAPVRHHRARQQPHHAASHHTGAMVVPIDAVRTLVSQQQLWQLQDERTEARLKWAETLYQASALEMSDDECSST